MANGNPRATRICIAAIFLATGVALFFMSRAAERVSRRVSPRNAMKQVGLGFCNLGSTRKPIFPAVIRDKAGRPLCSWRLLAIHYIEGIMLDFRFDEEWDGPTNRWFTSGPYYVFCCAPPDEYPACAYTNVVAVTGPGTAFDDGTAPPLVSDLDADTIVAIEIADSGIFWAEPGDLHIDDVPESIVNGMEGDGVHVLFADGYVWFLRNDVPLAELKKFFTIEGAKQNDREQLLRPYAVVQ